MANYESLSNDEKINALREEKLANKNLAIKIDRFKDTMDAIDTVQSLIKESISGLEYEMREDNAYVNEELEILERADLLLTSWKNLGEWRLNNIVYHFALCRDSMENHLDDEIKRLRSESETEELVEMSFAVNEEDEFMKGSKEDMPRYLTRKLVAKRFGVPVHRVDAWKKDAFFPSARYYNKRPLWNIDEIDRYAEFLQETGKL